MSGPLAAIAFLTRLPVPVHPQPAQIARATAWFPLGGLIVGAILLAIDRIAMRGLPPPAVDALLVVALASVTGALHLDGLADSADGLFGGYTPQRRLEIKRDVHTGSFGVVAIASVLLLKWAGLNALPPQVRIEAILLAPCVARFAMLPAMAVYPYAREHGVGTGYREHAGAALALGGATALITGIALIGAGGVYVLALAAAVGLGAGALATRLAGGVTGDVFGAIVEITEAAALLFVAAFAARGWIEAWVFA